MQYGGLRCRGLTASSLSSCVEAAFFQEQFDRVVEQLVVELSFLVVALLYCRTPSSRRPVERYRRRSTGRGSSGGLEPDDILTLSEDPSTLWLLFSRLLRRAIVVAAIGS